MREGGDKDIVKFGYNEKRINKLKEDLEEKRKELIYWKKN